MANKTLNCTLSEPKKWSGKYIVEGTESDNWPTYFYLKKEWFDNNELPERVTITITEA